MLPECAPHCLPNLKAKALRVVCQDGHPSLQHFLLSMHMVNGLDVGLETDR
jgi:hypothetical protein